MSAMQNKLTINGFFALAISVFLSACTTNPNLAQPDKLILDMDGETSDLAEVTADVLQLSEKTDRNNILVVFDIDNTLLAMEQGLGSDSWYEWQKSLSEEDI